MGVGVGNLTMGTLQSDGGWLLVNERGTMPQLHCCSLESGTDLALARRCHIAPRTVENAPGQAGAVYGSAQLEHRADCRRLPRTVERRGVVPQIEERRRGSLGTIAPVGRRIAAPAHLCDRAGSDARELGKDRVANRRLGASDDARAGRDQGDAGKNQDRGNGTTANGDAGPGAYDRAAPRCETLRAAEVGTNLSFMYDFQAKSAIIYKRKAADPADCFAKVGLG